MSPILLYAMLLPCLISVFWVLWTILCIKNTQLNAGEGRDREVRGTSAKILGQSWRYKGRETNESPFLGHFRHTAATSTLKAASHRLLNMAPSRITGQKVALRPSDAVEAKSFDCPVMRWV